MNDEELLPGLDDEAIARLVEDAAQPLEPGSLAAKMRANEPAPGITNPMWTMLARHVRLSKFQYLGGGLQVGGIEDVVRRARAGERPSAEELILGDWFYRRAVLVSRYAWTITDPWTVEFVAKWAGGRLIDPLAGTGYWAYLLGQLGVDVLASDLEPPLEDSEKNTWHPKASQHVPVAKMDAVDAVTRHGQDRTLLLSWVPGGSDVGIRALRAFSGDTVIAIGELGAPTFGDTALIAELVTNWFEVESHQPVQFFGLHDSIHVFQRTDTKDAADRKKDEEPASEE